MGARYSLLLMVVTFPLFLIVYLLLFFDLDGLHSRSAQSTQNARTDQLHLHSIITLQQNVEKLSADLARVTHHRDFLFHHLASNASERQKLAANLELWLWKETRESVTNHQKLLFNKYHLGCSAMESFQALGDPQLRGGHATVQGGFHGLQEVSLVLPNYKGCSDDTCHFSILNHFVTELLLLSQLQHPNLLHLVAICVLPPASSLNVHQLPVEPAGYLLEAGSRVNITHLQHLSWEGRLNMVIQVASLFHYLATSPLGSLTLNSLIPDALVMLPGPEILVSAVGQLVSADHPCHDHLHCHIDGRDVGIRCIQSSCSGLVSRRVLAQASTLLFQPLLKASPASLAHKVSELFRSLFQHKLSTGKLMECLSKLTQESMPKVLAQPQKVEHLRLDQGKLNVNAEFDVAGDDSIINQDHQLDNRAWPVGQDSYTYKKIVHADLPNRHDYPCPRSRASWGCVISIQHQDQAFQRCSGDPQCQAFVIVPHHRKKGWFTVFLKTGFTDPGKAAGSVLYIKQLVGGPDVDLIDRLPGKTEHAGEVETPNYHLKPCLDDVLHLQKDIRARREKHLMHIVGFTELSEDQWRMAVKHSTLISVTPIRETVSLGQGQSQVVVHTSGDQVSQAVLMAAEGPELFHLAQLAFYHLDRLLGLYRTAPNVLRRLEKSEVQFLEQNLKSFSRRFGPLVDIGGQLTVVISMPLPSDAILTSHLDLVKLTNLTNTVVPLTEHQQNQLEYLLLLWLTGTPRVLKNLVSITGELTHFMAWDAFHQGVDELLLYFHHCQFPRHTLELLWALQEEADDHCTLASQLLYELHLDGVPPASLRLHFRSAHQVVLLINSATNKLLQVVDQCVTRFGENAVFYDSR